MRDPRDCGESPHLLDACNDGYQCSAVLCSSETGSTSHLPFYRRGWRAPAPICCTGLGSLSLFHKLISISGSAMVRRRQVSSEHLPTFCLPTAVRIAIPNIITLIGLAVGIVMITVTGFRWDLLVLTMALDVADGAVARALHATTAFGAVLDSLADAVNFALGPAVLVSGANPVFLGLFCLSGWCRLVGFTLGHYQDHEAGEYLGFPTPLASGLLYSAWWALKPFPEHVWALNVGVIVLVVLEHVPIRVPKFGCPGSTTIQESKISLCR